MTAKKVFFIKKNKMKMTPRIRSKDSIRHHFLLQVMTNTSNLSPAEITHR